VDDKPSGAVAKLRIVLWPERSQAVATAAAGRLILERMAGRMPSQRVVRLGFEILSREST
jgi:hypothetical protein